MGRILVHDNPLDPNDRREHRFSGPYIDWLQTHYPQGLPGPHATALNRRKLAVRDYDAVIGEDDELVLAIAPTGPVAIAVGAIVAKITWAAVAKAIIGAVISVAINYAIASIFGKSGTPNKPSSLRGGNIPSPSPTYSLSVPTNVARLGQAIPVIYGDVVTMPDIASQPYTWFDSNEMYVGMILCLGQGWYDIQDIRIADTPVGQLQPGVVIYRIFRPDEHGNQFGIISGMGSVYENMYTSSEVSDQELTAGSSSGGGSTPPPFASLEAPNRLVFSFGIPSCVEAGQEIELSSVGANNGTYTIAEIDSARRIVTLTPDFPAPDEAPCYTGGGPWELEWISGPFGTNLQATWYSDGTTPSIPCSDWEFAKITLSGIPCAFDDPFCDPSRSYLFEGSIASCTSGSLGSNPFPQFGIRLLLSGVDTTGPPLPEGLFTPNSAELCLSRSSTQGIVRFNCEGGSPTPGGSCVGGVGPFVASTPGWKTSRIFVDVVFPAGLYIGNDDGSLSADSVTIVFNAEEIDDDAYPIGPVYSLTQTVSAATVTPQRRTFQFDVPYGRYRVCAYRTTLKSGRLQDQSQVIWTGLKAVLDSRGHPVYGKCTMMAVTIRATNGISSDAANRLSVRCWRRLIHFDGQPYPTRNPAYAVIDIFTNDWYGANRPFEEVDMELLEQLAAKWNGLNGFNAVFDQRGTVWEALGLALQAQHAFPATSGAVLTVVEDVARDVSTHCFTEHNIVRDSLQISYQFDNARAYDGVEIEYRSPRDFAQSFVYYPEETVFPESVNLFGCTDEVVAQAFAERLWKQRQLRREFVRFETELEGHLPLVGELIAVDHPLIGAPRCYIVGAIDPTDEWRVRIDGHIYVPEIYATNDNARVIDLNARVRCAEDPIAGRSVGVTLTGFDPSDVLRLTLPPSQNYVAWSPWGKPGLIEGDEFSGSLTAFRVLSGPLDTTGFEFGSYTRYDGYEAARASFMPAFLSGATQYTFYFQDGLCTDNTGGLSIQVEVFRE